MGKQNRSIRWTDPIIVGAFIAFTGTIIVGIMTTFKGDTDKLNVVHNSGSGSVITGSPHSKIVMGNEIKADTVFNQTVEKVYAYGGKDNGSNIFLEDLRFSFYREPYINPRIIEELHGWMSDSGATVTSINLSEANESNRFFMDKKPAVYENPSTGRKWISYTREKTNESDENGFFGYAYIGSTPSGIHILETALNTGGHSTFSSVLLLTLTNDSMLGSTEKYENITTTHRLNLKIVGNIPLGDRYEGKIKLTGNKLIIPKSSNMPYRLRVKPQTILIN